MVQNASVMASLGLANVSGDPNALPDGKYDGEITQSEYVILPSQNKIKHAITYRCTEGTHKGGEKQEWFEIGIDPKQADGTPAESLDHLTAFTPSQTEKNKEWYKKRFLDLGFAEQEVATLDISRLVGIQVTFGVKTKDGYQNVNFAEKRKSAAPVAQTLGAVTLGGTPTPEVPQGLAPAVAAANL